MLVGMSKILFHGHKLNFQREKLKEIKADRYLKFIKRTNQKIF